MRIASGIDALVGHTPLVYLSNFSAAQGLKRRWPPNWNTATPPAASRTGWPKPCWTGPSAKAS